MTTSVDFAICSLEDALDQLKDASERCFGEGQIYKHCDIKAEATTIKNCLILLRPLNQRINENLPVHYFNDPPHRHGQVELPNIAPDDH